jgi:hypothetical protein
MLWADSSHPNADITIQNNVFYNGRNYAIDTWQAYEVGTLIDHNVVYGSPYGVIDTSVIAGSLRVTNNRINTDPKFVDLAANNYHLQAGSPAIDTGASVIVMADFDRNPRPQGAAFDVGAYEYTGASASPVSNPFDFSISISTNSMTLSRKQSATEIVNAILLSGSAKPAAFAVSGLPPGVEATWSTTSCTVSCGSYLKLSASADPVVGTSIARVAATASGITKTANLILTITR